MNSIAESKVVVLGATGFIGSALLRHLQITHNGPVLGFHTRDFDLVSPGAPEALGKIMDGQTVLIIACRSPRHWDSFKAYDQEISIARNIASCLASNSLKKCLYLSTVSVYDDTIDQVDITEGAPIRPSSLYGVAKFSSENLLRWAGEQTETPVTIFRLCKAFGNRNGSLDYGPNSFIESALSRNTISLFGDGNELRDHIFIEDLQALVGSYVAADFSGTFNIVSARSHSFRVIADWVSEYTSRNVKIHEMPRTRSKVDQTFKNDAILNYVSGFRFTEMKQAIKKTVHFFSKSNTDCLKEI
jgi:nucleoside-diphosphate-sugar epimerase